MILVFTIRTPSDSCLGAGRHPSPRNGVMGVETPEQGFGLGPGAKSARRVEVSHRPGIHQLAAPVQARARTASGLARGSLWLITTRLGNGSFMRGSGCQPPACMA